MEDLNGCNILSQRNGLQGARLDTKEGQSGTVTSMKGMTLMNLDKDGNCYRKISVVRRIQPTSQEFNCRLINDKPSQSFYHDCSH